MSTTQAEQAVAYAALILADESIAITADKLQALLQSAGVEGVEPIWTTLFAKAFESKDVKSIITKIAATEPAVTGAPIEKPNGKEDENDGDGEDDGDGILINYDSDGSAFGDLFD